MHDLDIQTPYWDGVAATKEFTHPIPAEAFRAHIPPAARILDYGCGYGRVCRELRDMGYRRVTGIDISQRMIARGKELDGSLDLRVFDGDGTGFADGAFDACLAVAVLNCIPSDSGQERAVAEMLRVLKPGGMLFISDYPLQTDERNTERYRRDADEFGTYGVFRTEHAVFRHLDREWFEHLLRGVDVVWEQRILVQTMNGHASDAVQVMGRKRG